MDCCAGKTAFAEPAVDFGEPAEVVVKAGKLGEAASQMAGDAGVHLDGQGIAGGSVLQGGEPAADGGEVGGDVGRRGGVFPAQIRGCHRRAVDGRHRDSAESIELDGLDHPRDGLNDRRCEAVDPDQHLRLRLDRARRRLCGRDLDCQHGPTARGRDEENGELCVWVF